jgi:hypothetical protein
MDTLICLFGMVLLFGLPIAVIVFLYRKAEENRPEGITDERRIFFIFLILTLATGFVIALGIVFKSDWLFVIGFLIFGIVAVIRGARYFMKIADQESPADKVE